MVNIWWLIWSYSLAVIFFCCCITGLLTLVNQDDDKTALEVCHLTYWVSSVTKAPFIFKIFVFVFVFFFSFFEISVLSTAYEQKNICSQFVFHTPSFCFHQFIPAFLLMWCFSCCQQQQPSIAIHCLICTYATFGFQHLYYCVCFHKSYSHIQWWLLFGNQAKSSNFFKLTRI